MRGLGDMSDVDVEWARFLPAGPLQPQKKASVKKLQPDQRCDRRHVRLQVHWRDYKLSLEALFKI